MTDESRPGKVAWGRLTAGEWAEFQENPGLVAHQVTLLTRIVAECPWGPADDPTTYDNVPLDEYEAFVNWVTEQKPEPEDWHAVPNFTVDWNKVTVKGMREFQANAGRVTGQVAVLTQVVQQLPEMYGHPSEPETYYQMRLPDYEGLWRRVLAIKAERASKFR